MIHIEILLLLGYQGSARLKRASSLINCKIRSKFHLLLFIWNTNIIFNIFDTIKLKTY